MTATEKLLTRWARRAQKVQTAHYETAAELTRWNNALGVFLVALSTFVSTSVIISLQQQPDLWIKVMVGAASVLVAVLGGVQGFLKLGEQAERHRITGVRYGVFKREIEQKLAFPPDEGEAAFVADLRVRWDKLTEEGPTAPERVWRRVERRLRPDEPRTAPPQQAAWPRPAAATASAE